MTVVLIADHDGLARRMMHGALMSSGAVAAVIAARDGQEAAELAGYHRPAALLVDVALPPSGCLALIGTVLEKGPGIRILTMSAGPGYDGVVLSALKAGAAGHVDKDIDPDALGRLVKLAIGGEAIVPRRLAADLLAALQGMPDAGWRPLHSRLTTREWQIVELLMDGADTRRIAGRLVLEQTTVYSHVRNLMRKLGVHSRRDLVQAAERLRQEELQGR